MDFPRSTLAFATLALLMAHAAGAATSVVLPDRICAHPDSLFASAFDSAEPIMPGDPSGGSGGEFPGPVMRTLHVAGLGSGTQHYYLYVPADYAPAHPLPLLLALHGVAPYGSADAYAMDIRDDWAQIAAAGGFIVAVPVASDVIWRNGSPYAVSWLVPPTTGPNDYDLFAALRTDVEAAYNIERTRVYGWGFSAGGHVMHDLVVHGAAAAFDASTLAAYGVSAGVLAALACADVSDAGCSALLGGLPRRIPVDIHIGNSDPNYAAAKSDRDRFVASGWVKHATLFYTVFVGGHEYSVDQLGQVWGNLCPNAVTP